MGHRCGVVKPGQGHSMHCGQPAEMDPITREVMCSGCRMQTMDYAKALAVRPEWRWQVGMVDTDGNVCSMAGVMHFRMDNAPAIPSIEEPATKGWLLHLLREATGMEVFASEPVCGRWYIYSSVAGHALDYDHQPTEGKALATALVAAWVKKGPVK